MSSNKKQYKHLIIGFGKGGKTLAAYLAKHGEEVALIEQSASMYGGSCINIACIPSKILIQNAADGVPYADAFKTKNKITSLLRAKSFEKINDLDHASVITGKASFMNAHEVLVQLSDGNEELQIKAEYIYINTGSLPFIPPISGIKTSKKIFTSASLMDQSQRPEHLIIIGGGFIGLEFADMYAGFGAKVTLLDGQKEFLPHEDKDIADEILKVLTEKGIEICTGTRIERIDDFNEDQVEVTYKSSNNELKSIKADAVLVATGRKPNIEGLHVKAAGIDLDEKGYIKVDSSLKTSQPHIWAMGDINGGPQFTYISLDDFRIIRDQLFDGSHTSTDKRQHVAFSVFITPTLAHVGLREHEALDKGYQIKVAKLPAAAIPRARIVKEINGILKAVIDTQTNKILGCTLFCAASNEMINTIQVAMNAGLNYQTVRDAIYTHPSMTEAFNELFSQL